MRIGWFSQALPYLPSRGGFRLYGANLIRKRAQRHEIHLVAFLQDDDEAHLDWARQHCATVRVVPARRHGVPVRLANFVYGYAKGRTLLPRTEVEPLLRDGLQRHAWDVLHIEAAEGWVPPNFPVPKVLSLHDSWTLRCREMRACSPRISERLYYALLELRELRTERLLYPQFERCVVVAERDAAEVRRVAPAAEVVVIPYGTDTEYFHPVTSEKEAAVLVFHAHLGYAPNIAAALEFANDIFPRIRSEIPDVVF